jgi:hypothetical protein
MEVTEKQEKTAGFTWSLQGIIVRIFKAEEIADFVSERITKLVLFLQGHYELKFFPETL